jgi:iron(III) transport system ATP-binding protein
MRPESFSMSRKRKSDRAWEGRVAFSIYHGDCWDYHVTLGDQTLKVRVYQEKLGIAHGDQVFLEPDESSAIVMPLGATSAGGDGAAVIRAAAGGNPAVRAG